MKRHTINDINEKLSLFGYKLVSNTYLNNYTPIKVICPTCDSVFDIKYRRFLKTPPWVKHRRCPKCYSRQNRRLDYDDVAYKFACAGLELLSNNYISNSQHLLFRCRCGSVSYALITCIHDNYKCVFCRGNNYITYETVYKMFKIEGCELLESKFISTHTKMKYKCSCGNISYITYDKFKTGRRCMKCSGREKLSYSFVKSEFEKEGLKLLSKRYISAHRPLDYICSCGNIAVGTWALFQQGHRCNSCKESRGERRVKNVLDTFNIYYKRELRIEKCRYKKPLPFDFAILDNNNNILALIEYDGEQHFDTKSNYIFKHTPLIEIRDNIKTDYCTANNIPFLRIPFYNYGIVDIILFKFLKDNNITSKL